MKGVRPNSGLKPLKRDVRDFKHSAIFGAASLTDLPKEGLGRTPLAIKDQRSTQFCTAFAISSASEFQEGIVLSPEYQAALEGYLAGEPILNGAEPRSAMKAACVYGSLEQATAPYSLNNTPPEQLADFGFWPPALFKLAKAHQKASYLRVDGPYDTFDNIRNALYNHGFDRNQVVMAFGRWYAAWNNVGHDGIIPAALDQLVGYHAYLFIDWKIIAGREYLVIQNSYGEDMGDHGLQYIDRGTVNAAFAFSETGCYTFADVSPETVQAQRGTLISVILDLMQRLLSIFQKTAVSPPAPRPAPTPVPAPEPAPDKPQQAPSLSWGTPEEARHSARVVMDEYALQWGEKDLLCAVIQAESGFRISAHHSNRDEHGKLLSTDYGICQINDYYHIGHGKEFQSVTEVLSKPELSVRFMVEKYKAGRLDLWIAYKNGSYKKYL